jgi:hypothetical protein
LVLAAALLLPTRGLAQNPPNQCERVVGQLEAANKDLTACRQSQRELERDVRQAQTKQLKAQDERDAMETERNDAKKALEEEKTKHLATTEAKKRQDGTIEKLEGDNARLARELERARGSEARQKTQVEKLQRDLAQATAGNQPLADRLQEVNKELEVAKKLLEEANKRAQSATDERIAATGKADAAKDKLEAEEAAHRQTTRDKDSLNNKLQTAENQVSRLKGDIERLDGRIRDSQEIMTKRDIDLKSALNNLREARNKIGVQDEQLTACKAAGPQRCPTAEPTEMICRGKFPAVCGAQEIATSYRGEAERCQAQLALCIGGDASDIAWRKSVDEDLHKLFDDVRRGQRCEVFKYELAAGELKLTGKLMDSGARTVRDRAAEIKHVLPSLRVRDEIELVTECPVSIDGWRVELGSGGAPRTMRFGELPVALQQRGDGLPTEGECGALGAQLEREKLMRGDGSTGIWAQDDDHITGLCQNLGGRWVINPRGYDFPGLLLRKGN